MKVVISTDGQLKFSNGFQIYSYHGTNCCEYNYLDFEETFKVGEEFEDLDFDEFVKRVKVKEDRSGLVISLDKVFKRFVPARSEQNGYYSNAVGVSILGDGKELTLNEDLEFVDGELAVDEYGYDDEPLYGD